MESLDTFRYISYVRSRWRFVAVSCTTAVVLAALISFLLPRQYTATAQILIAPPAGGDPRSALALSSIYLESLKTYEHFVDSATLFQKAASRFQLRALLGSTPIESLKRKVLRVELVRNTRILQISATLPDAVRAQALAQFLAEETVALNRSLTDSSGQDLVHDVERQDAEARARLDRVEGEWGRLLTSNPIDDLQSAIEQEGSMRADLEQQVTNANVQLADAAERERSATGVEAELIRKEESNTRARLVEVRAQIETLARRTAANEKVLAGRFARRDQLDAERKAAQTALTALDARLRDTRNELNYRGERLTVIDPGVVPERPSSPNIALNLAAALLLGLLFPLVWLAIAMNLHQQRVLQALGRGD